MIPYSYSIGMVPRTRSLNCFNLHKISLVSLIIKIIIGIYLNPTGKSLLHILDKCVTNESKHRSWKLISWSRMKVSGDTILTLHFQTPTVFNLNSALETASQGWMQDRAANDPSVVTIIKKAPAKVFSRLKAPSSAFTFKTLFRHLGRWTLTSSRHEIGTPTQLSYLIKGTGGFKNSFRRRPSP